MSGPPAPAVRNTCWTFPSGPEFTWGAGTAQVEEEGIKGDVARKVPVRTQAIQLIFENKFLKTWTSQRHMTPM